MPYFRHSGYPFSSSLSVCTSVFDLKLQLFDINRNHLTLEHFAKRIIALNF